MKLEKLIHMPCEESLMDEINNVENKVCNISKDRHLPIIAFCMMMCEYFNLTNRMF